MNNTIDQISHDLCTGCNACYNKCPVNAISMNPDSEGFLFPQIDYEKCINCGQCLKVCPAEFPKYVNKSEPACYAVMANDEIRKNSSSGGVFTLLAEWALEQNGVVCGAAYSEDCYEVNHILVDNYKDLAKLRGSKYVQSNIGTIYQQIKALLGNGKLVLFTGTPCQVAALNSFLGKVYDRLYTVDLVCHGVPSPFLYQKFIQEQEEIYGCKATKVSFRDKDVAAWDHSMKIEFSDGQIYQKKRNESPYLKAFLNLLSIRKSCGKCQVAKLPRQGDMTIADFWDIHRFNSKYDDRQGTSMVLTNNEKGVKMLEALREKTILCETAPLEHAVKYNAQLKYSSVLHPRRNRFYSLITDYHYGFEKALDYGSNRRFDIGYIGWWYGANYGSVMTNFALHEVLTKMGKTVLMLDFPIMSDNVPSHKPDTKSRRFANRFYEQSLFYRIDDYERFNYHCDSFVVGSDQLWNWWSNRDVGSYHFFLDFADDQHKKIAYSTSFGHDSAYYPEDMRLKVSYLLHRFDAVSVRETGGVTVCKRDFNVDAVQTVDPVFLCSMESYEKAIALSSVDIKENYVLAYILNPTEEKMKSISHIAKELKLPYYVILDGQDDFEKLKAQANDPNVLENVEIADWLKYFKNASYIVTDSFHGFCYSIIYGHDMTVFPNKLRGLSRFESLCQMTGLHDRLCNSWDELLEKKPWETKVDFEQVQRNMQPKIEFSKRWLKEALEMPKRQPSSKELELKYILKMQARLETLENMFKSAIQKEEIKGKEYADIQGDKEEASLNPKIKKTLKLGYIHLKKFFKK